MEFRAVWMTFGVPGGLERLRPPNEKTTITEPEDSKRDVHEHGLAS